MYFICSVKEATHKTIKLATIGDCDGFIEYKKSKQVEKMEKVHKIHFQQSTKKTFSLSLNVILFVSTVGQLFFTMKKVHLHLFKKFFKKYLTRQVSLVQ